MKLPRYLQLALVLTAGAAIWSQFADEEISQAPLEVQPVSRPRPAPAKKEAAHSTRVDLFSTPHSRARDLTETQPESEQPEKAAPTAPPIPLQVLGAWWENRQRIIVLTDGKETWPVCERCKADGRIWIGSSPVDNWILKTVANDHLLFEWQPSHIQQRLELDELQSEPTH